MKKLGMDEFLRRARAVHGDEYDYSETELHGVKEKSVIICRKHGRFEQSPALHMQGSGCPECAKEKRKATMLAVHGVEYASQSIEMQRKSRETRERKFGGMKPPGSGRKAMGTEEFVRRAKEVHGGLYDYSETEYVNNATKVRIICPVHGAFEQLPSKHLAGQGCPDWSHWSEKASLAKLAGFVEKARAVHGDRYDYSGAVWAGAKGKLMITCPEHGPFMQSPEKHLAGCGCPHPDCVGRKRRERSLQRHGTEYPQQDPAVRAKVVATSMARYGAGNIMSTDEGKARMAAACSEKFGADSPFGASPVREKILATNVEKYGGRGPLCSQEVRGRSAKTSRERYGVDNPMQSPDVQAAQRASVEAKYGVSNPMKNGDIQRKQRAKQAVSMWEKYGADSSFGSVELRKKAMATNVRKYGVSNVMKLKVFADKMMASKAANGTSNFSEPEEVLYQLLVDQFGADDVIRQYKSDEYPWSCDFYILSRNLYIELNGTWTHGGRWYRGIPEDQSIVADWNGRGGDGYYVNAVRVWTVSDPAKRAAAEAHGLNYVAFWDDELGDAAVWFTLGCPDGRDWEREYSWLPDRELRPAGTARTLSGFVRRYQFGVVYERELAMWAADGPYRRWPSLRMFLYANRLKYLGKGPGELTDREILSGFTISGILRGYTTFDASVMGPVTAKFGIGSIYDPCAGWGERMAWCAANGVAYHGMDVNAALEPGYRAMMVDLGGKELAFAVGDSGLVPPPCHADAVLTCPPYGGIEIYSGAGAENLVRDDFLEWWGRVAKLSLLADPRYFCFQVNRKYRDGMLAAVEAAGYVLVDEIACHTRSSHLTRSQGGNRKRESESMLVLERRA